MAPPSAPHRVVVIGSGFGGLFTTKALKRADVEVTLLDRTTTHLFQPLLYQVATGILSEGEIAPPTRGVLRRQRNATVLLGEVDDIDVQRRTVTSQVLGRTTVTPYDSLVVAAGAGSSYFGNQEFSEFAPGLKTIDDALEVRGRLFGAYEMAELETDPDELDAWLTFVVVGAGPTGVEMAGQIAELSRRTLRKDFRNIDPATTRVILVDADDEVLGAFGGNLSVKAERELKRLGVEVQLGAKVVDVDATGLVVEDRSGERRRIVARTKVWAAGVQASPLGRLLAERTGVETDRAGRVVVEPDLSLAGHPEVFCIGDMAATGNPGVAQVALQSGKHVAKTIRRRLDGKSTTSAFHYVDKGSMAVIARARAVAQVGPLRLSGFLAWTMWLVIHLVYLTAFKSRVTALLHWGISFIGRGRSERVATLQQVVARTRLQDVPAPPLPTLVSARAGRTGPPPAG